MAPAPILMISNFFQFAASAFEMDPFNLLLAIVFVESFMLLQHCFSALSGE